MLKVVTPLLIVAGAVALSLAMNRDGGPAPSSGVAKRSASPRAFASGRIEGAAPEVELRPQLSGRVVAAPAREGQQVAAGELVLQLDDSHYRHQSAAAEAELERAAGELQRLTNGSRPEERREAEALYRASREEVDRVAAKWERIKKLRDAQAIAVQEADDQFSLLRSLQARSEAAKARWELLTGPAREDEIRVSRARVAAAQAQVDLARNQLERTAVRAPRAGRIMEVNVEVGELAGPEMAAPAIVLVDASRYQVRAHVEEIDALRIDVGAAATIVCDGLPGRELSGRVSRLSPRMTRKELRSHRPQERLDTKVREIWIDLIGEHELVIGLPVDVTIEMTAPPSISESSP